jgi:hypothetical protein
MAREGACQLLRLDRRYRPERSAVMHTCDLYAHTFGLPGAVLAGVPLWIGSPGELRPYQAPGLNALPRTACLAATKVAGNSLAARILDAEALEPALTAVIPNGIDAAACHTHKPSALSAIARSRRRMPFVR